MVISTNLGYVGSQIVSYFVKKKCIFANTEYLLPYSAYSFQCSLAITFMLPKRSLNVYLIYLPKCTEFFFDRFLKIRTSFEFYA